jgi:hypothetical protein
MAKKYLCDKCMKMGKEVEGSRIFIRFHAYGERDKKLRHVGNIAVKADLCPEHTQELIERVKEAVTSWLNEGEQHG